MGSDRQKNGFLSAVAYMLWSLLLQRHPVSRIMVFSFLNPVFGVILSALLLGEAGALDLPRCLLRWFWFVSASGS